jgi:hypothetical protein
LVQAVLLAQLNHQTEQTDQILFFLAQLQLVVVVVQVQIQVVCQPILEVVVEAVDSYQVRQAQALADKVLPEAQPMVEAAHLVAVVAEHQQSVELEQQLQQRV